MIVTPMVPELRALRFFTIGHMHVTVFRGFLSPKAGPLVMASITPASSFHSDRSIGMLTPPWHLTPHRAHGGCDRSTGNAYSFMAPDPTFDIFRGLCTPIFWFVFPIGLMRLITVRYFCHFIWYIFLSDSLILIYSGLKRSTDHW
jgi:hypothetical protein